MPPANRPTRPRCERAKAAIDRDDLVVGLQDRFDESLLLMVPGLRVGLPGLPAREREPGSTARRRPAPATIELIRERNALDLALYEHARARFERDLGVVDDLDDELDVLRLAGRWRTARD